jgi:hypothetical protein
VPADPWYQPDRPKRHLAHRYLLKLFERLRSESESIREELFRQIVSKRLMELLALVALGRYEIPKATAALVLSSKVFQRLQNRDTNWAKARMTLGLSFMY